MTSSLTSTNIAVLAGIMVLGAFVPSVSVLAVSARSAALGFAHGALTSIGIVVGDIAFILIAIYGLSVVADLMGSHFAVIKYLGAAYLVGLGMVLLKLKPKIDATDNGSSNSTSSFFPGCLLRWPIKRRSFIYLGLFPALIDLPALSLVDTGIILAIATVAVGGPKLLYAFMAERAVRIFKNSHATRALNVVSGSMMVSVGAFVAVKA